MKSIKYIILLTLISINLNANETTYELAKDNQKGIELYGELEKSFYNNVENIKSNKSLSAAKKERNIKLLRDGFMQTSREIHLTYRQPFLDAVLQETNEKLPKGRGVQKTLGSDIYKQDKNGKVLLNADGSPKINTKHRGMSGDMDLGGDPQSIKELEKTMAKYGVKPTTKGVYNHLDFDSVEVTINNSGLHVDTVENSAKPKKSLHEAQMYKASINPDGSISAKKNIKLNAYSKETYNFVAMSKNQAGASYVLTTDNTKKAIDGFKTPASTLLKPKSEAIFQGMNKGTLKSISSGKVTNEQLIKIIARNKLGISVEKFKEKLTMVKEGHIASGVGITDTETMSKYQKVCKDITDEASSNAAKLAKIEMDNVDKKIKELNTLAENTPEGAKKEAYKRQAKMWAEQNADSKLRIDSGVEANDVKLNAPTKTQKVLTNGAHLLQAAGLANDGYEIYTTYTQYTKGKITKDKAVSVIGGKSAGIVTDVVVDTLAAKAVQGASTTALGTISTLLAPVMIGAATSYTVSKATEEGLALMSAYKNEKLLNNIADKQMKKTADRFIEEANMHLTKGIQDGDFNNFVAADDLSDKLYDMYERTGDISLLEASNKIDERSSNVVDFLEAEHGVSIYVLKEKLAKQKQEQESNKKVVFFSSNANEDAFRQSMQQEKQINTQRDNKKVNQSSFTESQKNKQKRVQFRQSMKELSGSLQEIQNAMIVTQMENDYNEKITLDKRQEEQKRAFKANNQAVKGFKSFDTHAIGLQTGSTTKNKKNYESVGTTNINGASQQSGLSEVTVNVTPTLVEIWDHSEEDNDMVEVSLNGKVIYPKVILKNKKFKMILNLYDGVNKLEFKALNIGTAQIPKNSAAVYISDVINGSQNQKWSLNAGEVGLIIMNLQR